MNPSTGSALISLIEPAQFPRTSLGELLGHLRSKLALIATGLKPRRADVSVSSVEVDPDILAWAKRTQAANGFGDA